MILVLLGLLSFAGLAVSAILAVAVAGLYRQNRQIQQTVMSLQRDVAILSGAQATGELADAASCLSGYRISLGIVQDHAIPTFRLLLKDALCACDADVTVITSEEARSLAESWKSHASQSPTDLLIFGEITCNGYSEIYFRANLNYLTAYGELNPTAVQLPHGGPQTSLVVEVMNKLNTEVPVARNRVERGIAMQELRD